MLNDTDILKVEMLDFSFLQELIGQEQQTFEVTGGERPAYVAGHQISGL